MFTASKIAKVSLYTLIILLTFIGSSVLAATSQQKQTALESGLEYLAQQQYGDGSWYSSAGTGVSTGQCVQAFQNAGYYAGTDVVLNETNYGDVVGKGLNYLFSRTQTVSISPQTYGDPDINGNGYGIKLIPGGTNSRDTQSTGMSLMAIIGSGTPDAIVTTGSMAGRTYAEVAQDVVDYFAFGQVENVAAYMRGGWRYWANYSGSTDQSCTPWPIMGMLEADSWGLTIPQFVHSELDNFMNYIQMPDGGAAYMGNGSLGSNVYRTGALLSEQYFNGYTEDDTKVQMALSYINSRWQYSGTDGNFQNPGALWAAFMGLKDIIGIDDNTWIQNLRSEGMLDPDDEWNWSQDYWDYLVNYQYANGSWAGAVYYDNILTTAMYCDVLSYSTPEPATLLIISIGSIVVLRKRKL
ncbi:MAG: hypothetical protein JW804_07900 [Sedimentisphaerales bacterium]|nr:hypothetical protein [Sedimentisphaerales bacterium]